MSRKYETIVFIGRFQPLHNAHVEILKRASMLADTVICVVGSSYKPRTFKNPFTFQERAMLIESAFEKYASNMSTMTVKPIRDTLYNDDVWVKNIQTIVHNAVKSPSNKIAIIGYDKDDSSAYLRWFPRWNVEMIDFQEHLDATQIRELYFQENSNLNFIKSVVPDTTLEFLIEYKKSDAFKQIIKEKSFLDSHKKVYEHLPYPPTFQTADSVVIQSGHVLLVKRRAEPGKGLWALPGGYLNAKTDRSILDAAIRELKEETKLKVPEKVLRGCIADARVFDAINRSERGRIITQAFLIRLFGDTLPKVQGSDDAEKAQWVQLSDIKSEEMFEDHWDILTSFLSV